MSSDKAKRATSVDVMVGERVRLQRINLGLTQGAVAGQLGVTFQQVQKYEKGTNRIGASRLQRIAQILRVPIGFFFEEPAGSDAFNGVPVDAPSFLTSDGIRLNRAFVTIKDAGVRRRLIDLVRSIADAGSAATSH